MSQLKKGAILSYVNIGLTNIIGLILTPFIIRSLGDSEYGLYTLIGSFVAYLSILDLGLNNAIIRYTSKYRAQNDKQGEENFLATTFIIYSAISAFVVILGIILYFQLPIIFKDSLTESQISEAEKMFLILIFNLAITLPGGAFTAICNAYEKFIFPRFIKIIKYISRAAIILAFVTIYPYAITLVWIDTILNIIIILITAYFVFKKLKIRIKLIHWNRKLVADIFSYSIWIFLSAIVMNMQWNAGQVILGISANTITVAIFGVGVMLGGYYGAFAGAINTLLLPQATKMSVTNNNEKSYNSAIQRVGRLNGFILFLILGGFWVYGKDFIILWVGETYISSWEIAILIMIAMTLPLLQAFGNSILEAKKKNRFRSLIGLFTVSSAVIISIFLVPTHNFRGVIYPLFIALILNSLIMAWYYNKVFGYQFFSFLRNVILKPIIILIPIGFISAVIRTIWDINTWLELGAQIGVFVLVYLLATYFLIMNTEEKKIIWTRK